MREIYNLIPAEEVESDAQAEPVNIEKLKIEFEMEWRGNRKEHILMKDNKYNYYVKVKRLDKRGKECDG